MTIYFLSGLGLIIFLIMLYGRSKGKEAEAELTSEYLEESKGMIRYSIANMTAKDYCVFSVVMHDMGVNTLKG